MKKYNNTNNMKDKDEIIDDKSLIYLFLVYISPLMMVHGLRGLLRGKAVLRYITIEGPLGCLIDIIYISVATYFNFMFIYHVIHIIKQTIKKKAVMIMLFICINVLFYILSILYVVDEYYSHIVVNSLLMSIIVEMVLVFMNYIFITITIYYIFKIIKIIK